MDIKKQIGQLFVVGYQGVNPCDEFLKFVNEWSIGGVIVFVRNIDNVNNLPQIINKIKEAAQSEIFVAVDQEGGLVLRILSDGSMFPSAMALAATNKPEYAYKIAKAIAKEMLFLGLNFNLAPVLDINHPNNPGIGARSFGETPEQVVKYAIPFIKGLKEGGVLSCAKHFPGKGHAKVDSHLTLPTIPYSRDRIFSFELKPFIKAIEADVDAIMTAHVYFPAFENEQNLPATLSKSVMTDLLRNELKFDGILITDDLEMGAITETFGVADAAKKAFLAGADLLLICHTLEKQVQSAQLILEEIKVNSYAQKRLEESISRIEKAKSIISSKKLKPEICEFKHLSQLANMHSRLIYEVYNESVLLSHAKYKILPILPDTNLLALCPKIDSLVQVEENLKNDGLINSIKNYFPNAIGALYEPKGAKDDILNCYYNLIKNASKDWPLIIFSYNAHLFCDQAQAIKSILDQHPKTVVIALRNPYDLALFQNAGAGIATFGFRTPAIITALEIISGVIRPKLGPWSINIENSDISL